MTLNHFLTSGTLSGQEGTLVQHLSVLDWAIFVVVLVQLVVDFQWPNVISIVIAGHGEPL